jgi:RNA-directed DNA polymerase
MKREGYLIEKVADLLNLQWAFWKAQKGKRSNLEVIEYSKNLTVNLELLRNQILTQTCIVGNYSYFMIYDPKERQICAAPFAERVLHHALMNVCHANFEKYQIFDSYATRLGKGTDAAIKRAAYFQRKYKYFLKIDCRKYFDSIDHDLLKKLIFRRFKDQSLLKLLYHIIDSYHTTEGKGLPIGNLTSQYFANHYLAVVDHYVLEVFKAKALVRYMDDLLIWSDSAIQLNNIANELAFFCKEKLSLTFKHCYVNTTKLGVDFLGFRIFPSHTQLSKSSKKRLKKNYVSLTKKMDDPIPHLFQRRLVSLFVRPLKTKSFGFRKNLIYGRKA